MAPALALRCNRTGPSPHSSVLGPFDALVAAPGFSATSVITSPNQSWVPKFAIARDEIVTFADGRWGHHEFSHWPQAFDNPHYHVACIPRRGSPRAPSSDIVWRTWESGDWQFEDCGVPRYGQLKRALLVELEDAAECAISTVTSMRRDGPNLQRIRHFLTVCLRHCIDRLRLLPSERSVMISLGAHAQRLILELAGLDVYALLVLERIESQGDYRGEVLDVLGVWSPDPSVVNTLHRAGIPVWFQQPLTRNVPIYAVVALTDLPDYFSRRPSYPRLVIASRDLSASLNTPGEWQRAMDATFRRQLCSSRLPALPCSGDAHPETRFKRARLDTEWRHHGGPSLEHARPSIVPRDPRESSTLGHHLRVAARGDRTVPHPPRSRERGKFGPSVQGDRNIARKPYAMNPFRQHYASSNVEHSEAWARALRDASPLPQPTASVAYYFPPPFLIDRLIGYEFNADKVARYIHHMAAIRTFCRARLFDRSIAGRPLTISEWRDALWGDYALDDHAALPPFSGERPTSNERAQARHRLKQNLRGLFGNLGSLRSYDAAAAPVYGGMTVTLAMPADHAGLHRRLVWEAHETNWRCELLAVDALLVGANSWSELQRWTREAHVSEVWGLSRSGLALSPNPDDDVPFCWAEPTSPGWERCRIHLQAFVDLLVRWPGCPSVLRDGPSTLATCDGKHYARIQQAALNFYVRTFVAKFGRLPTPPVRLRTCDVNVVAPSFNLRSSTSPGEEDIPSAEIRSWIAD